MSSALEHFPDEARSLLTVRGADIAEKLGIDVVREVVISVLSGENIRQATEKLTRRRIALLNAALLVTFIRGQSDDEEFVFQLPVSTYAALQEKGLSADDKRVLLWLLGLTGKQVQNVLRSDQLAWTAYIDEFTDDLAAASEEAEEVHGPLSGDAELKRGSHRADLTWPWALSLLSAIGAQTLAIRGAEKSLYGKFFEKVVLAGALHVLGLELVDEDDTRAESVYWLSSRGRKRESDATAYFANDEGVRFDIGFIGAGNTEISPDKVSRFERENEIGGETIYMHTFIIVDRIGKKSRIVELAKAIDGTIVQMSAKYWPVELAAKLEAVVEDFESPFDAMDDADVRQVIAERIATAPFEQILRLVAEDNAIEDEESNLVESLDDIGE